MMIAAPIKDDTAEALSQEAFGLLGQAKGIRVTCPDDYRKAGAFYATVKDKLKEVEAERKKRVDPLNKTVKLINADYKGIADQLQAVLDAIEAPMLAFRREEERQRREAEEAARKERERIEAEARKREAEELARLEEARRVEAAARKAAEEAANPVAAYLEKAKAEQAAADAEAARQAAVDAMRERGMAAQAVAVIVPPKTTAAGTSFRKNWKFEVTDLNAIPREYLVPNEQLLGQIAREQKENAQIPGVRFYAVESIGGR